MWDKELELYWNILSVDFNDRGELEHFYGFWLSDKKEKIYIDVDVNTNNFELWLILIL